MNATQIIELLKDVPITDIDYLIKDTRMHWRTVWKVFIRQTKEYCIIINDIEYRMKNKEEADKAYEQFLNNCTVEYISMQMKVQELKDNVKIYLDTIEDINSCFIWVNFNDIFLQNINGTDKDLSGFIHYNLREDDHFQDETKSLLLELNLKEDLVSKISKKLCQMYADYHAQNHDYFDLSEHVMKEPDIYSKNRNT